MSDDREGIVPTKKLSDVIQSRAGKKFSQHTRDAIEEMAAKGGEIREGLLGLIEAVVEDIESHHKDERTTADETRTAALYGQVRAVLSTLPERGSVEDGVRALLGKVVELTADAEEGRNYRTRMIDATIEDGIRAYGTEKYNADLQRSILTKLTTDQIIASRVLMGVQGDARFPGGKRMVNGDEAETIPVEPQTRIRKRDNNVVDIRAFS